MSDRRPPLATALVAWTLLVWATRINNIWTDDSLTSGEQWSRTALALSFTALAVAVGVALWQRRPWLRLAVAALGAWGVVVWVVRSIGIATAGHDAGFVAVHLVLAVVTIALSALAWRQVAAPPSGSGAAAPRERDGAGDEASEVRPGPTGSRRARG